MGRAVGIGGADLMLLERQPLFLTGSRAYGAVCSDSDFDIAVTVVDFEPVLNMFDKEEVTPSAYFGGVKFRVKGAGAVINLIPLGPRDFVAWYYATLAMPDNVLNKTLRHSVFTLFVQGYKLTVPFATLAQVADWWPTRPKPRKELADAILDCESLWQADTSCVFGEICQVLAVPPSPVVPPFAQPAPPAPDIAAPQPYKY